MSKLIILSLSFIFLVLIILPLSLTLFIKVIPGGIQPSLGNTEKIYGTRVLLQAFLSPEENLTGIGVSIKNPNFANKKKTTINIYDENNQLIRTTVLNGQNIADGKFVKILFEPIGNSRNKKFIWSILSSESNSDDALQVFLTDQQTDWSLDLKVNERISDQWLSYVTLHKPSNLTTVLAKVLDEWIIKIKGDNVFFVSYGLSIVVLLIFISSRSLPKNLKKDS